MSSVVLYLHPLVTHGPRDLDIAAAMSQQGYDAVKWAEGQSVLAELVSLDQPAGSVVSAALEWYADASEAAHRALAGRPTLLAKLGLA